MQQRSIITWKDALKLAVGIAVGLTSTLLIILYIAKKENPPEERVEHHYIKDKTIREVLNERASMKYREYIDSVYINMPEEVLIAIYIDYGTSLSPEDAVKEYWYNEEKYVELLKGNDDGDE